MRVFLGLIGLGAGIVSLLLAPFWIAFAVVGFLIGMVVQFLYLAFLQCRRKLALVASTVAVILLVAGLIAVAVPNLAKNRAASRLVAYSARYRAEVLFDASGPCWKVRDVVEVEESHDSVMRRMELLQQQLELGALDADSLATESATDWRWLTNALTTRGWNPKSLSDGVASFYRQRTVGSREKWLATRTSNPITVPTLQADLPAELTLYPFGEFELLAPRDVVGLTNPAPVMREAVGDGSWEKITLPLEFPSLPRDADGRFVEVELLHPLLRNQVVASVRRLAGIPFVNWLVAGLFGIFQDKLRSRVFSPLTMWACNVLGIPWLKEASAAEDPNPEPIAAADRLEVVASQEIVRQDEPALIEPRRRSTGRKNVA